MRVGKTNVVRCDFCGEIVVGDADVIRRRGKERHFCSCSCSDDECDCPGACLMAYLWEHFFRDKVTDQVDKEKRAEWNLIHKQVCPACKYRLQQLL